MQASRRPQASSRRERRRALGRRKRNALRGAAVAAAFFAIAASLALSGVPVNTALHQHVHLTIVLNGVDQVVPAFVGIDGALWRDHALDAYAEGSSAAAIHTHGTDGVLHVELSAWHPCSLADFFRIWGEPFSSDACLWFVGSVSVTVDGSANTQYGALLLQDGQQIVVRGG